MNEHIKEIRKALDLSQEKFGEKVGVTKAAISRMELGTYNTTDSMVKLICAKFNINEAWLINGTGSMFVENDRTILEQLSNEYKLDHTDALIIESYLKLSPANRKAIKEYARSLSAALSDEDEEEDEIEKELENYRLELEAEKKGITSPALPKQRENLG